MIDLHCHILPGIDDGPKTLEESLDLARKAVEQGITHILCTPHHHNGKYLNSKKNVISHVEMLQKELDLRDIPLTLFEGQEVRIFPELEEAIEGDDILFCDVKNRYLLVEFPSYEAPSYAMKVLGGLVALGKIPIIVHPERNGTFVNDPNLLLDYLDIGCLAQVTAPSILGKFGKKIQKTAEQMIESGTVQMVASDAHHIIKRTFYLKEALNHIGDRFGEEKAFIFEENARAIINGDKIEFEPYYEIKAKKRFWDFFKNKY